MEFGRLENSQVVRQFLARGATLMKKMPNGLGGRFRSAALMFCLLCIVVCAKSSSAADTGAAQRAVEEAKKYAGLTLTIEYQAGLQALDPLNYSGPMWEKLTGIKTKVVEVPLAEVFSKIMLDYRSGGGSFDVVDVVPAWMPDLAQAGVLE